MMSDFVKPRQHPPQGWSPWEKRGEMAWESRDETKPRVSAPYVAYSEIDGRCMIRARNGGTEITAFGRQPEDLARVCCSVGLTEWSPKVPERDGWWWVRVNDGVPLIGHVLMFGGGFMSVQLGHRGHVCPSLGGVEFICEVFPPVGE